MQAHTLAAAEFDDLAAGFGTPDGIRALRAAQVDRRLLMLREVFRAVEPGSAAEDHYALLQAAQARAPEAFAATVAAPHFGAWVTAALREARGVVTEGPAGPALPHFANIAVAAAIRARCDFELDLPLVAGAVFLPGLGRAKVSSGSSVRVTGAGGRYTVGDVELPADLHSDADGWAALRVMTAEHNGCHISLQMDDLDPYRDMHGLNACDRLDDAAVAHWAAALDDAWALLVQRHQRYAMAIAAGLKTVVPLTAPESGHGINATSMHAFGSISLTPPKDGLGLAASLLHEFQHAKLGGLLDLVPLYEDAGARRFYAPWRDDPRPLGGLLQGVYAFLGVTDFWRGERQHLTDAAQRFADFEFARWRDRVRRSLDLLQAAPEFNADGRRFLAGMRSRLDEWSAEPVQPLSDELAVEAGEDHYTGWRLRNVCPDEHHVGILRDAWLAGLPAHSSSVPSQIVAGDVRVFARNARLDLAVQRITEPAAFQGTCAAPSEAATTGSAATPADLAYARGDFSTAVAFYHERLSVDSEDRAAWVGLALARLHSAGGQVWRTAPELPYAVHRAVCATGAPAPDPVEIGDWLDGNRGAGPDQVGGGSTTQ